MVIDGREIKHLAADLRGRVLSAPPHTPFLTGKGSVWKGSLSVFHLRGSVSSPCPTTFLERFVDIYEGTLYWIGKVAWPTGIRLGRFPVSVSSSTKGYKTSTFRELCCEMLVNVCGMFRGSSGILWVLNASQNCVKLLIIGII